MTSARDLVLSIIEQYPTIDVLTYIPGTERWFAIRVRANALEKWHPLETHIQQMGLEVKAQFPMSTARGTGYKIFLTIHVPPEWQLPS
ncbi:MAG: hypothetical protein KF726_25795 [Anaerolineae bacterium]|nr:hypothetical protein [Anaerolineae bacterium]